MGQLTVWILRSGLKMTRHNFQDVYFRPIDIRNSMAVLSDFFEYIVTKNHLSCFDFSKKKVEIFGATSFVHYFTAYFRNANSVPILACNWAVSDWSGYVMWWKTMPLVDDKCVLMHHKKACPTVAQMFHEIKCINFSLSRSYMFHFRMKVSFRNIIDAILSLANGHYYPIPD